MALERRDPVPPGRYSVFVNADEAEDFSEWLDDNAGNVHVIATVDKLRLADDTDAILAPVFSTTWRGQIIEHRVGSVVLFDIFADTPWVNLGLPTIETGLSVEAFQRRETENPEYIPGVAPLDEVKGLVLLGLGVYLGGIVLARVLR